MPQNNMNWTNIIEQVEILEMKIKIIELDKHFVNIKINPEKYIFSLYVYDMIEQYNMKELYCS